MEDSSKSMRHLRHNVFAIEVFWLGILVFLLSVMVIACPAQTPHYIPVPTQGIGAPTAACTAVNYGYLYINNSPTPNVLYQCNGTSWYQVQTNLSTAFGPNCPVISPGISAISVNGVLNPACFSGSGSEMGAWINAAYAACVSAGAPGCDIDPPAGVFPITTPIQIMTKGVGARIKCASTATVLNWTPTSGTMFQFAPGGAGTATWPSGIENCTITGPTTGTATLLMLGVSASDSTGRTAQGVSIRNSTFSGFNIQGDLESQAWNITFDHVKFENAITNGYWSNVAAVNSGENIHFESCTFNTTGAFLTNYVNMNLLSAYTTLTAVNFDNVQLSNNGGEISYNGIYFEDPNSARGSNPYLLLNTGVTEGTNIKMINQQTADTSPAIYNKGTLTWLGGEMASGSGTTPLAVKNDVHGHSFICGDISVPGQLVDSSTSDQKSIDCTPGFGLNLSRTPFSITDSTGGTLSFRYTNAGVFRWQSSNGFEIDSWGPDAVTPGKWTAAGLANDGSHGLSYMQCTPTGTSGTCSFSGAAVVNGSLTVDANIPNGIFIGGAPGATTNVGIFKGAAGDVVITPSPAGASVDLAVNNAAETANNFIVFDNGDTCISNCSATDPGTTLNVNGNTNITGNLTVHGTVSATGSTNTFPNGILIGSSPSVNETKGASGALVVTPATGALIDIAFNNATATQNTIVGFDNGHVCVGLCGATDPGVNFSNKGSNSSSNIIMESLDSTLGVGNQLSVIAGLDDANTNNSAGWGWKNVGGSGAASNVMIFGLSFNSNDWTLNGNGQMNLAGTVFPSIIGPPGFGVIVSGGSSPTSAFVVMNSTHTGNIFNTYDNGDVGIDSPATTTGSPTVCFNTTLHTGVSVFGNCSSLRKLKFDIRKLNGALYEPFGSALLEVSRLHPISYTSKTDTRLNRDGSRTQLREIGFIAEDIEKLDSRLSTYDEHGDLVGVEYSHMTALLTKAIQEQQKEIDQLKEVIQTLQAQIKK